jgi:hypothetical protein
VLPFIAVIRQPNVPRLDSVGLLRAYFDTTVYSELETRTEPRDVTALCEALRADLIRVHVSPTNIAELLGQADTDRPAAIEKLQRARHLVGFHRGLLKEPTDVFSAAFTGYASGSEATASELVPEEERRRVVAGLSDMIAGSREFDETLSGIVVDTNTAKDRWLSAMKKNQQQALTTLHAKGIDERATLPFDVFWTMPAAERLAEGFAEYFGCVEGCRQRGIPGLLQVRVIRLGLGCCLSQIHTQLVPTSGNRRQPDRGDVFDVWHAIFGATASVFLTFDIRLADHLERIPSVEGFIVVRSVRELLQLLE